MKQKFYAVLDDNNKLIYTTWEEARQVIPKLSNPKCKSFSTREEAEAFLNGKVILEDNTEPSAYIDGSYDVNTGCYSFGGTLIINNTVYTFNKKYDADEYSSLRNVAGEIKGAGYIIQYCINRNINNLHIYYDYLGIEKWFTKEWKAKSNIAIEYVKFVDRIKDKINVTFHKVKSHTNNYYNDLADYLAKKALNIS